MIIAISFCMELETRSTPQKKIVIDVFPAVKREKDTRSGLYKGVMDLHGLSHQTFQLHQVLILGYQTNPC